jgi:biopolymer transport protein ExbD
MRTDLRAEINVTPLVDVCLVLLIIFMLVTPLLTPPVELPATPEPEAFAAEAPRTKITVAAGPPVRVTVDDDRTPLSDPALEALLAALHAQGPGREIVLRADRRLPYGEVKRVLKAIQGAGFKNVGLAAEKKGMAFDSIHD